MINYELFKDYERIYDKDNPYVGIFKLEDNIFIIEPNFYTQLLGMKEHHYDKFNLIRFLDEKGAFLVRNSSDKVCEFLDISKYTLYAYLKDIKKYE